MTLRARTFESPVGTMLAVLDEAGALVELSFMEGPRLTSRLLALRQAGAELESPACEPVVLQLNEYFDGVRRTFDIPCDPPGSPFQRQVWDALRAVPYGETVSYGELAHRVGQPDTARAVGRANATNPVAIVIPCHRAIGADGSLTGYAGGLAIKQRLLELEAGTLSLL